MESSSIPAVVFRGTQALCREFGLVLEAKGIEYDMRESAAPGDPAPAAAGPWVLTVAPSLLTQAYEELGRYSAERNVPRPRPPAVQVFGGAGMGAVGYAFVLLATAYFAGIGLFGADWLSLGALDAGSGHQWWRAVTALTLHLDQEHLLGNLLFGVVAGAAAGRLLGPGVAWASILGAAALANVAEMVIAPSDHRAVGASTAVFAALGLLAGLAWRQRLTLRERLWYRWAPLIAGICLLTLLGTGTAHVDVLGHALGFLFGTAVGWVYARTGVPRGRGNRLQLAAGFSAASAVALAWLWALSHGP